ncbi:MAG: cation:proton antiporter [Cocleimonas sp.]
MTLVFFSATVAVLVIMALALIRAFVGPGIYDRILAVNMFGTKTVLFIALYGFLTGRPEFLDIALIYALINFIGVIAVLNFVKDTIEKDQPIESSTEKESSTNKEFSTEDNQ